MGGEALGPSDKVFWDMVKDLYIDEATLPVVDDKKRPIPEEIEWGIPPTGNSTENYDGDFPLESDI
jgi:hypothetical protein